LQEGIAGHQRVVSSTRDDIWGLTTGYF